MDPEETIENPAANKSWQESPSHTSRRRLLAVIPVAALTLAACSSKDQPEASSPMPTPTPTPVPATPDAAIQILKDGNKRFASKDPQIRDTVEIEKIWTEISTGQQPFAMVLGCADSRLAPELLFDQFVGDIFVVREAGNLADSPTNLGSLEFGHAALRAKALVVLGHSSCGAVQAAFEKATPGGNIQAIVDAIAPGIVGAKNVDDAIERNVLAVMKTIRGRSELLRSAEKSGALKIVGAVYDLPTATVRFL
jgi:carbonic anhydrase